MASTGSKHVPSTLSNDVKNPDPKKSSDHGEKKLKAIKIKLSKDSNSSIAISDHEGSASSSIKDQKASKSNKVPKKRKLQDHSDAAAARKAPMKSSKTSDQSKKDKKVKKTEVKPKGPVDVERQCGVPLPQGGLCARSLTCKSHSMGSKRAVTGRSQPYDILLAQYQKKNHAKLSMSAYCSTEVIS